MSLSRRFAAASIVIALAISTARAQTPSPATAGGLPVNYDETLVGTYTLPDPLRLRDGTPVKNAKTWRE